ncbi:hypothetical protein NDU88_001273 [Pleurodeles waltl]|uniref:Uncharacterized protein n=1 Tax=Pleurodeles waltl TaxID=8319 RepID=A0AAV7LZ51_PLEWA|nr:hypothetical protein NDU88_001273 [Pleurodeles waltl]
MAVPSRRDPVLLLPSAQLCRERMMQHFGATLLGHLECDWSLSFRPVLDCVQPVFRCLWCSFEHALALCLSLQRPPMVDTDLLMFPIRAHSQTCALRMCLLREAVYEIPFLEEDGIVSFMGPARGAALNGFGALDHTCSMVLCGVDLPILTYIEVEELLRSIASI